jgi:hypothetical protein
MCLSINALFSALGLFAILATSAATFSVVTWVGVGYLSSHNKNIGNSDLPVTTLFFDEAHVSLSKKTYHI